MSNKHQRCFCCLRETDITACCSICQLFPPHTQEAQELCLCKFLVQESMWLHVHLDLGPSESLVERPSLVVSALLTTSHAPDPAVPLMKDEPRRESKKYSHGHKSRSLQQTAHKHSVSSPNQSRFGETLHAETTTPVPKLPWVGREKPGARRIRWCPSGLFTDACITHPATTSTLLEELLDILQPQGLIQY